MSTIGDDLMRPSSPEFGPAIEALVVYNSNPVAVAPQSHKVVQGFAREDLLTVVLEHFHTDTADYADYILPATTQLEHWDVHLSYGHTDVLLNSVSIAHAGQSRPFLPRIKSATKRPLSTDKRTPRRVARVSMVTSLFLLDFFVRRVTLESTCERELTQLVANHLIGDIDWHVLLAVVHSNGQADEIGQDH
jgi:anaerobic selenocysteine-containing dehydrogenase